MEIYPSYWIIGIPTMIVVIYFILTGIVSLLKFKKKELENISIFSTSGVGAIIALLNICLACTAPIFGIFGYFLNFPAPLVSFMFGMSTLSISKIIMEKWKKEFLLKEIFIIFMITLTSLFILHILYNS